SASTAYPTSTPRSASIPTPSRTSAPFQEDLSQEGSRPFGASRTCFKRRQASWSPRFSVPTAGPAPRRSADRDEIRPARQDRGLDETLTVVGGGERRRCGAARPDHPQRPIWCGLAADSQSQRHGWPPPAAGSTL